MKRLKMGSDKKRVFKKKKKKKVCRIGLRMRYASMALQKLFQCCQQVFFFNGSQSMIPSSNHVQNLSYLLDGMEIEDVGLSRDMQFFTALADDDHRNTPRVTSATIYKSEYFELCIFFLPANAVIPLHDHPEMTVFSKLLLGTMHVKSYDWVDPASLTSVDCSSSSSKLRLAEVKTNAKISSPCKASVLYPSSGGNIHEFRAITPCAMLDVLGPPYSIIDSRDCTYYRDHPYEVAPLPDKEEKITAKIREDGPGRYKWLEETQIPEDLEMEGIPYMGPQILHHP